MTKRPAIPRHPDADLTIEADYQLAPSNQIDRAHVLRDERLLAQRKERRAQILQEWNACAPAERDFLSFNEVVNELAREPGSLVVNEAQRELISERLLADFRRGALGDCHLLHDPEKLFTPADLIEAESFNWDAEGFRLGYIDPMILPRDAVASYFRARGVTWPASWGVDPTSKAEGTNAPTAAQAPQAVVAPEAKAEPVLHEASDPQVRDALAEVYEEARRRGEKPPNVVEVQHQVQAVLARDRRTAAGRRIERIAGESRFEALRWRPGQTKRSKRPTSAG
jgi:hypothetical protein